ncbi:MAG: hypothetical protein AUH43_26465 [Acidobacteria bacterium 13_1_40CM_65_14]|nr:MAG: hypothetical protein AUH43_26465 [Acidobacteria bacterium 13_1_40CM_65_14]OLC77587.1 MAG: hypothetical protein AUH72_17330 [Acidobacteria bacterium 13_1_40CM_4_65_8]
MNRRQPPAFGVSFLLHAAALAIAVSLTPRLSLQLSSHAADSSVTKVSVQGQSPAANDLQKKDDDPVVERESSSTLIIQGFTFDFGKIAARGTSLFPFLSLRLPLEPPRPIEQGPRARTRLTNPFASAAPADPNPPLVLSDTALQTVVDSAWSRRYRWRVFRPVRELTASYNADAGRLPLLLRRYVDQNMLQPYLDTAIPDMRLWTELGIAADHADYITFITKYASAHPSTKATTELLFLLDKLAQGSYDALATLIGTSPARMEWTHTTSAEAYELLLTIRRYYRSELDLKDLMGSSQLRGFYDRIRVAILTSVIATTPNGYRASDARFLVGSIYWRQGSVDEAARWWRDMTVDPADSYVTAYSQVLDAVRRAGPNGERLDRGAINSALDDERRNWVDFWETRLKQFGYSFDVY